MTRLLSALLLVIGVAPAGWAEDVVVFSQSGMAGEMSIELDASGSISYQSRQFTNAESWSRRPSQNEWTRFWAAMDAAGVWTWKEDYGEALHTDCSSWSLVLQHDGKRMSSGGCSMGPKDGSLERVIAELTKLRGDASSASSQVMELARQLRKTSDVDGRKKIVGKLAAMGPAAAPAAPALIELLAAPPVSWNRAAPGPEPVAVARAVAPLLDKAEKISRSGNVDEALRLYEQALKQDPQSEGAARARASLLGQRSPGKAEAEHRAKVAASRQAELADEAAAALSRIGEPAVAPLARALEDGNVHRRRRAAAALGGIGRYAGSAIPALRRALSDPTTEQAAARALLRVDSKDLARYVAVLAKGLKDPDRDVARSAAEALRDSPAPDVVPPLLSALDDARTFDIALEGLRYKRGRAAPAVPALVVALKTGTEYERSAAASILEEIGPAAAAAVPALIDAARDDSSGAVRESAARAIGAMGPAATAAVPVLINNLRYGDGGHSVAGGAAIALAKIGPPAVSALIAALKTDRLGPATAMTPTGYQGPVYPEIENVKTFAAFVLMRIGKPASAAVPALRDSLRDPSARVRQAAAGALREIERGK